MKRRLFILSLIPPLLFLAVSLSGCVLEPAAEVPTDNPENISETDLATRTARPVALEDALGEMYSLMDAIDAGEGTRSAGRRNVASVELLGAKQLGQTATRSGEPILDSLLYLVNFVEGGFAVLGADESLASVIALTAAGQINAGDFDIPSTAVNYTLEDLWVEEDQDYLLGGVDASSGTGFVARMILDYAVNGGGINTDPLGPDGGVKPGEPDGPTPPPANPGVTYTWHTTDWVVDNSNTRRRLLDDNIRWHQNVPFNLFCPPYKDGKAAAGCVAIAVMQIMAHHKYPETTEVSYHGWYPDVTWDDLIAAPLGTTIADDESLDVRFAAADISSHVGTGVNMWYNFPFSDGSSFATPNQAAKYLTRQGYDATRYVRYREEKVKTSILEGFPTILGGISNEKAETRSGSKEKGGHAWVVDGWMERTSVTEKRGSDGSVPISITYRQKLVHCNWGWSRGTCNGYYHSGTFKLKDGAIIPDENTSGKEPDHYDAHLRMVTYELP